MSRGDPIVAKVSIIVPVYNIEKYLRQCIDSLVAQTLKDIEIILVDDGSPDSGGEICDEYAEKDERIKVIHKKNGGLSDARNAGIDLAEGDFIGFVDGDDLVLPDMFEALYRACIENKTEMAACDRSFHTREDAPELPVSLKRCRVLTSEEFFSEVLKHPDTVSMGVWNKLYGKHLFDNLRFPVGKMHEDNATLYRLVFQIDRVAYIPVQYYIYAKRPGSITSMSYGSRDYDRYEADHNMYLYITSNHPAVTAQATEHLCISNLSIAQNMVKSRVHDRAMYKKVKKENRELLPAVRQNGSLTRREMTEIRFMCYGYYPYLLFLRLRQLIRKLHFKKSEGNSGL